MTHQDISASLQHIKQQLNKGDLHGALESVAKLDNADSSCEQQQESLYLHAVTLRYLKQYSPAERKLTELLKMAPSHARGYQEQGHLFLATDRKADAAHAFYRASLLNPALIACWRALHNLYQHNATQPAKQHVKASLTFWSGLAKPLLGAADLLFSGSLNQADQVCRQYLQQHKHDPNGLYILALIDIQAGVYDEAEFLLESCYQLAPQHDRALAEYTALLNRVGKYHLARSKAGILLEKYPHDLNYQVLKGVALVGTGDVDAGIAQFEHILQKEPERASLWLQLGHARKSIGQLDAAIAAYKQALIHRADYGDAYWSLANTKAYRFSPPELTNMKALLQGSLDNDDRIHLAFAIGKGLDDSGNTRDAFDYYQQGNAQKYALCQYSPDQFEQQINRYIDGFSADFFAQLEDSGCADTSPIFIVGLPRAGSTLLEQILSSHSQIEATHELHNILSLARRLRKSSDYPNMLKTLSPQYFARFGEQYIEQTKAYRKNAPFFIDKMPNNFLHIGLIKCILPNAKIIDARRDPMDCCYSGYRQLFAEGQDFSYNLDALGRYYRDYERIMSHWDKVLAGWVLKVQHEDVVADLEGQVKRMLTFCNLPFEEQCLRFYETERAVHTPSADQVRQPINTKGMGRWRAVEESLAPLTSALNLT